MSNDEQKKKLLSNYLKKIPEISNKILFKTYINNEEKRVGIKDGDTDIKITEAIKKVIEKNVFNDIIELLKHNYIVKKSTTDVVNKIRIHDGTAFENLVSNMDSLTQKVILQLINDENLTITLLDLIKQLKINTQLADTIIGATNNRDTSKNEEKESDESLFSEMNNEYETKVGGGSKHIADLDSGLKYKLYKFLYTGNKLFKN